MSINTTVYDAVMMKVPELEFISNSDVREQTVVGIKNCVPSYFWEAPAASSTKHHNQYCWGEHGLWIHMKMAFTAYEEIVESYLELGEISEYEADLGRAAIILHDGQKYGDEYHEGKSALSDHDMRMAKCLRSETNLDRRALGAISSHMGPWYDGPVPETALENIVHMADVAASTKNATYSVYKPSDSITKLYPTIPRFSETH